MTEAQHPQSEVFLDDILDVSSYCVIWCGLGFTNLHLWSMVGQMVGQIPGEGVGLRIAPWQRGVHRWTPGPSGRGGPATASDRPALQWKRCNVETTKIWHHFWSHLGDDLWCFFWWIICFFWVVYVYNVYAHVIDQPYRDIKDILALRASANNHAMSVEYDVCHRNPSSLITTWSNLRAAPRPVIH